MSSSVDAFLRELSNLPTNSNPYLWISEQLKSRCFPHYSKSVKAQLFANIFLVSFGYSPTLGMVKALDGSFPVYLGSFCLLIGFIPPLIGEIAVWSIAASFIVHLQSLHGQHYSFHRRITASNCLGVVPIFHLIVFIPLDVIAGTHYAHTILLSKKINNYLLEQANTWTLTSGFDVNNLLPMVPDVLALEARFAALKPVWQATYIFHAIAAVLLVVSLTTLSSMYLTSVNRLLRKAKELQLTESLGQSSELLAEVREKWTGLVIGMILFVLISAFTFGLSIFASFRPLDLAETYILISFWSTTSLSLILTGVYVWLSWILRPEVDEVEKEKREKEGQGLDQLARRVSVLVDVAMRVDSNESFVESKYLMAITDTQQRTGRHVWTKESRRWRFWPWARKFAKEVHPSLVEDKIGNPYLNGKSVHPLDVLDRKAKEAKNKPKFKCGSLDPSDPDYYNTDLQIDGYRCTVRSDEEEAKERALEEQSRQAEAEHRRRAAPADSYHGALRDIHQSKIDRQLLRREEPKQAHFFIEG